MEEIKRKRGRPKKVKLPEEIQNIVLEVLDKEVEILLKLEISNKETSNWDVPINTPIEYFDINLSYELTGYRPITKDKGLDFDPDWFTETREVFLKTGKYCLFRPNTKAYSEFWDEQYRRCRNGMTVNGYTITGDNYFFLNFFLLMDLDNTDKAGGGRLYIFPAFYAGLYEMFHYIEMCRRLRLNACIMKSREIGYSECISAILANSYNSIRNTVNLLTAFNSDYLNTTLGKVWNCLSFINDNTEGGFFKLRQVIDKSDHKKASVLKMVEGQKVESGWMSQIIGITADKPSKIRGYRSDLLVMEEAGCHIAGTEVLMYNGTLKKVEDILIGDILMGDDGTPRTVLELHSGIDLMYKITPRVGDVQIVNSKHIIYGKHRNYNKNTYTEFTMTAEDFYDMVTKNPRKKDGYKLIKSTCIKFPHQDVAIDPYLFGYWLGDGNSDKARFTSEDQEIIDYLIDYGNKNNFDVRVTDCKNAEKCKHIYFAIKEGTKNIFHELLRQLNVLNNKHIPDCYIYNDEETLLQLLAGLIDSDGSYNKDKHYIEFSLYEGRKHIVEQVEFICHLLGMKVSRDTKISKACNKNGINIKGGVTQYRLRILYGHSKIPTKISRKQSVDRTDDVSKSQKDRLDSTFKIEKYNVDKYYGFSLDKNQLFLLKDFTVCHNSWPGLTKAYIQSTALVGLKGAQWGLRIVGGTSGDTGPALAGLRDMCYNPQTYAILPFKHRHNALGEECFTSFFVPCTKIMKDRKRFLSHRGYVDEEAALKFYNDARASMTSSPQALILYCAEFPFTLDESFSLEGDNKFNKVNIAEQLTRIRALKECPNIEIGRIGYTYKDNVHVVLNITGFSWKLDNVSKLKILEHPIWTLSPKKDESGKVIWEPPTDKVRNLYVIGVDGIDIGKNQTSEYTKDPSDFCAVVYKRTYGMLEPLFVAIYKDRPNDPREAYKITLCLAKYYNALINIEATRMHFFSWARDLKETKWFMRRPRATLSDLMKNINKLYGTPATAAIILHLTDLIADYVNDYCHLIWFDEILDELNRYTDENKTKFDIVASMGMAMLADEELLGVVPKKIEQIVEDDNELGFYTDENGIRRWGVIPKLNKYQVNYNNDFGLYYDRTRIRTSDPRLSNEYL